MVDGWFRRISNDPDNPVLLVNMIQWYEKQLEEMYVEAKIKVVGSIEQAAGELPGILAYRLSQYNDVRSIHKLYEIKLDQTKAQLHRKYSEHYQRDLKVTEIKQYVDGEDDVVAMKILLNQIDHLAEQYNACIRAYEMKNFQLSNITKLRVAGMADSILEYN